MRLIPTLNELVSDPSAAVGLPASALAALQAQCAAVLVAVGAALASSSADGRSGGATDLRNGAQPAEVRLLTIDETAIKLSVTREWLYRRAKRLGLAVKLGDGTLRISNLALDAYIKAQTVSAAHARRRLT